MSAHTNRGIGFSLGCIGFLLAGLIGCEDRKKAIDNNEAPRPGPVAVEKKINARPAVPVHPASFKRPANFFSFKEAVEEKKTILLDPPSLEEKAPPDVICNGKESGKIFETIKNELWDKVAFINEAGKRVKYHAILTTELGEIHLDLFGDAAPHHVCNFICLAKLGYYDEMKFYKSLNDTIEDSKVAYIETGCPRGTGERGSGSIGYWLKPEISDKLRHEEGTIGAYIDPIDPNSAACRFYIAAAAMPFMDSHYTIFGKVTRGLDIVRIINTREVRNDDLLKEPVLIRRVTIQTTVE